MKSHRLFLVALLLVCSVVATAQEPWLKPAFTATPAELLAAAGKVQEKDVDVVVLFDDNIIRFDDTGRATATYRVIYKVLTAEGAENWASVSAHYEPWREHKPVIKARVITPDGAVHMLDPKTLADAPTRDASPNIYTDDRQLQGPLPAVAVGAIVEQEIVVAESQSMLTFGQIYQIRFGSSAPTLSTRMIVDAPARIPLRHSVQLLPTVVTDKKEADGRVVLTFTQARMEKLQPAETNTPGSVPLYPYIKVSTGTSWRALASEYSRIVDEKIKDADVRVFVDQAKKSSDREAVIASLVRQLHEHVRYTGVEFGESSIIPQPPAETLRRKYGDCKDKATLLVAMLRAAGIPAHVAMLSTGPGEDSPKDLPGMGIFDHAIVYVPGSPAHWIDATAENSRVNQFPPADQGRLALVVDPATEQLIMTPELPSSANRVVETRDVFLAEKGPARFIEVTEALGTIEGDYRSYYQGGDKDERRKSLESYVKGEYVSDRLLRFETSDSKDFSAPFKVTVEAAEARRGFTTLTSADVAVQIYGILGRLPDVLTSDPDEEQGQEEKLISERDKKKRQNEFVFQSAFVTEWKYRIHPPAGFVVRAVPEDEVYNFGPATLTTRFNRELKDGVLLGSFVFDSGKRRWSAAEVQEFRDALKKWKQTSNPQIGFSLKGTMLLEAGKVKEGVTELKNLSALHPKEAIHKVQIAYALLNAGLGEGARAEARAATQLEPTSAEAFRALGWVLQHDLVGRRFRKGFDLAGAKAAYRKSLELDAKDNEVRADYAILLEHDKLGNRYGPGSELEEALKQYQTIGDKLDDINLTNNPLYLRLHMGQYKELITELQKLTRTDDRLALLVAALGASQGSAAALAEGNKLQSQGGNRTRVLSAASSQLLNIRFYPEAADVLVAAVEGSDKAGSELGRARLLKNVVRFDPAKLDRNDPANLIKLMFAVFMEDSEVTDDLVVTFASPPTLSSDPRVRKKQIRQGRESILQARTSFRAGGVPPIVLRDIVMTLVQVSSDFDGVNSYRVRYTAPGSSPLTFFVSRQGGKLYGTGSSSEYDGLGHEVLQRVAAGDVESPRKIFDWIREEVKIVGGEDPLAGPVFPRLWTRGQTTTADEARLLAAVMIATGDAPHAAIPILEQALAKGVPEAKRPFVQLALARAYVKAERFPELKALSSTLLQAYPESLSVFQLNVSALNATGGLDLWEALVNDRLKRLPDDVDAIRSLSHVEFVRGDVRKAIAQRARLIALGKVTVDDYNSLSWDEIFDGNITPKGLEYGHQGNLLSQGKNAPLLHTLAAVYAEVGKIAESREMILKAMDQWGLEEPNSTCWYVFGRIAEQYGMTADAIAAYNRVERPDFDWQIPSSTYQLAARRLAALAPAGAAKAGK